MLRRFHRPSVPIQSDFKAIYWNTGIHIIVSRANRHIYSGTPLKWPSVGPATTSLPRGEVNCYKSNRKMFVWDWQNMVTLEGWLLEGVPEYLYLKQKYILIPLQCESWLDTSLTVSHKCIFNCSNKNIESFFFLKIDLFSITPTNCWLSVLWISYKSNRNHNSNNITTVQRQYS